MWDGFHFGPEGAQKEFAMDQAHPIEEFAEKAPELIKEASSVYYGMGEHCIADSLVQNALKKSRSLKGRSGLGLQTLVDPKVLLGELRIKKDEHGVAMMKEATRITSEAHIQLMKSMKPGLFEKTMHGLFISEIMSRGAAREGYGSIMASGANATVLHYVFNDAVMKEGDLFLVDAGAEYNFFTADVTRTYPVNGSFTKAQKRIYEKLLQVQKNLIELTHPGLPFTEFQNQAVDQLIEVMMSEKLVSGDPKKIKESEEYKKYYPHGSGHWLGMDVHDVGLYQLEGKPRELEPGMCFTIEPGIYIPPHDTSAPKELRGIGIRIEDDILVTDNGYLNLTQSCPKEVSELEAIVNSQ